MKTVTIFKAGGNWNIRYDSDADADRCDELFGTDTLPMPYMAAMSFDDVCTKLEVSMGERLFIWEGDDETGSL
jgi:hypothetical protein